MKQLIFILVILIFSVWLGLQIHDDPGYILVSYKNWSVETSLWIALILLILLFVIVYGILRFIDNTLSIPQKMKEWRGERTHTKAVQQTHSGIRLLAEGNWSSAEKDLVASAQSSQSPLVNYLAAARAAQAQQAYDRRDLYIRKAYELSKGSDQLAIGITQAQLQLESTQFEAALATLTALEKQAPKNPQILKLLADAYFALKAWEPLGVLLPKLRKQNALNTTQLDSLERQFYVEMLGSAQGSPNPDDLHRVWESVPRTWRYSADVLAVYTAFLLTRKDFDRAVPILEVGIKKAWHPLLIKNYGLCHGSKLLKQIAWAESWIPKHPQDKELLLALGRLCKHQQLWGKAKDYLQQCALLNDSAVVHQELGDVLEQLGEHEAALELYRKGLDKIAHR